MFNFISIIICTGKYPDIYPDICGVGSSTWYSEMMRSHSVGGGAGGGCWGKSQFTD